MKRKVLHLRTVSGRGGGPEKTLLNGPRFLQDSYDVRLAYIRPECDVEYDLPARAQVIGVDLVDIAERGPVDMRTIGALGREIRRFGAQLLHAHDYKTNALALALGKWFGIPAITTVHGYGILSGRMKMYCLLDRWLLRHMGHVVVVSDRLRELMRRFGVPASRCTVVENAIDLDQFTRGRATAEAKAMLGVPAERLIIGSIGRLVPGKGFEMLIRAVDQMVAGGVDAELWIAGDGPERSRLEQTIVQVTRPDRMKLLGHRTDLATLYEAMDVFVLASDSEGLPNVLLEAMAMQVPVVATRVGGIPRLVTHEKNGLLIRPGASDELFHAMNRLAADSALQTRLKRAARETVATRYSFEARMQKIRAVYETIWSNASAKRRRHHG